MRLLLVEDDRTLGEASRDHMVAAGHGVDWFGCLEDARLALDAVDYDLILLDLRLPDGNGLNLLQSLRQAGKLVPVIILTAHDQISERIAGLNAGADDYLPKPFDLDELTARILAVSRRYLGTGSTAVRVADVVVDVARRHIEASGEQIFLSAREWAVLERLVQRPGAIVSKRQIEEALYALGSEIESNTIEVYISRLRRKIGANHIRTLRGVGYRLE